MGSGASKYPCAQIPLHTHPASLPESLPRYVGCMHARIHASLHTGMRVYMVPMLIYALHTT